MSQQLTVLGLGGSARAQSWSELLLRKALLGARELGMKPLLFSLAHKEVPMFRDDLLADQPPVVVELLTKARRADVLIFCTPVYHGTIAGVFKNAVDFLEGLAGDELPWLTGKAAGLMAVGATPMGGSHAISAMDHFCRAMRATTVPTAIVTAGGFLGADGALTDQALADRLQRMLHELGRHARLDVRAAVPQP